MARIYKELIWIEGYGKFEKIVNVSKKGIFSVEVPKRVVKKNLNEVDKLWASNLKELEKKFFEAKLSFERFSCEFEEVIFYDLSERQNFRDGSGIGMLFNWGVFHKIRVKDNVDLQFVRGYPGAKDILESWHKSDLLKNWTEIPYSEKVEGYFLKISGAIEALHQNLSEFLKQDLENLTEFKLLEK